METISIVIPGIYLLRFLVGLQFLRKKFTRKAKNNIHISILANLIPLTPFLKVTENDFLLNSEPFQKFLQH